MRDEEKPRVQPMDELVELRQRITELEEEEAERKQVKTLDCRYTISNLE